MERLGIIGGTFDPIHLAHLHIAEQAIKTLKLDKIIFIPAGSQPLKINKKVTEASLRFIMVKKAIEGRQGFEVSDYEINKEGMSYTFETLEHFSKSDREIYFITGADCLMNLGQWKGVERIFQLCKFVVFTRPGYSNESLLEQKDNIEHKYSGEVIILNLTELDISSTGIREAINLGEDINKLIPKKVIEIIKEKNLYGED
ncbi:nicotinate-nucleotide adenylyltransferase [Clostridium vincentii]|uniref:Probable nicotinate-nucleotide adenylyltransferase n=1 Tax=Clostridium vincentii TaxID=52704 RepID=A0A2T0BEZ7_9CLOT|nr:nicotinate-nucleotide adenylyltransferase [Clostridium vincentii]PRR82393.1 Nicotinate-nucleotide adenylyltransferase [Clostridium vincentii]